MVKKLEILPEAAQDIADAYDWYERCRVGLGVEFLDKLDDCFRSIQQFPESHGLVRKNYRRALVQRFPYSVFYEHESDLVAVYCVFHGSQNPKRWQRRLR